MGLLCAQPKPHRGRKLEKNAAMCQKGWEGQRKGTSQPVHAERKVLWVTLHYWESQKRI